MNNIGKIICLAPLLLLASCNSANQDSIPYEASYPVNSVQSYNHCYDASIVSNKSVKELKKIIQAVTKNLDAQTIQDTDEQYIIKRRHHIGLVTGSGGETITFSFKKPDAKTTFITINTKRDLVGIAGQKALSCDIANQIKSKF